MCKKFKIEANEILKKLERSGKDVEEKWSSIRSSINCTINIVLGNRIKLDNKRGCKFNRPLEEWCKFKIGWKGNIIIGNEEKTGSL